MTTQSNTYFAAYAESGAHSGDCILGAGTSKAEALESAIGPKPWTPYQTRLAKKVTIRPCNERTYQQWR